MSTNFSIDDDMPAEVYHKVPAVSASVLMRLYTSCPKKLAASPVESSDAMDNGTAFHSYLLDTDFHSNYFVLPDGPVNERTGKPFGSDTKAYADWLAFFSSLHDGKKCVDLAVMKNIEAAALEFRTHPYGGEIAGAIASTKAKTELSLFWMEQRDDGSDYPCKARLDIWDPAAGIIRDLKTTRNANPQKFQWDIRPTKDGRNYWIQAAWYARGARVCGMDVNGFEFIAVELDRGHGISFHDLEAPDLHDALPKVLKLADTWQHCIDTNTFPNYPAVRNIISLTPQEE